MRPEISHLLMAGWLCVASASAQVEPDWKLQVRECIAARKIDVALSIAERRLAQAPNDWEAHGWHGRLLAWSGRWQEAEAEYRRVLEVFAEDTDILLGLAEVLTWQQRRTEALQVLDHARTLAPSRAEIYTQRGRVLRSLGRTEEARESFQHALQLEPGNTEAKAGLAMLQGEPRHELRVGTDTDFFNFAETAQAAAVSLRSRLSSRWSTQLAGSFHHRFSEDANRFAAGLAYRLSRHDTFTVGGATARDQGVIPRSEAFFAYDRGFSMERHRVVRGVEASYQQRWLWFRDARILTATPGMVLYFPRDWYWTFQISFARSRFSNTLADWQLSGLTRLNFPVHRRVMVNVSYGVGTENFSFADQLGRFSARTYGTGGRFLLGNRQEITASLFYQDRSQARSQTSLGFSYAVRF